MKDFSFEVLRMVLKKVKHHPFPQVVWYFPIAPHWEFAQKNRTLLFESEFQIIPFYLLHFVPSAAPNKFFAGIPGKFTDVQIDFGVLARY